jgi:hypothetical protein
MASKTTTEASGGLAVIFSKYSTNFDASKSADKSYRRVNSSFVPAELAATVNVPPVLQNGVQLFEVSMGEMQQGVR